MIKKQIEFVFFFPYFKRILATYKGKAGAQLEQEFGDILRKLSLQFKLLNVVLKGQKIENVRVFEQLVGQIGLRFG